MKHSVTKKKPKDVWVAGRDKDEFKDDENIIEVKERLEDKVKNDRSKLKVNEFEAKVIIDRTLFTELSDLNARVWESAGFQASPTISEMIKLGL